LNLNVENIQDIIDTLKMSQSRLEMECWQTKNKKSARNIEDLHFCGMAACLGGYVAISRRFRKAGGMIDKRDGSPIYNCQRDEKAVAEWFGISYLLADRICCMKNHGMSYGVPYSKDVTKEMVIDKLEMLIKKGEDHVH